MKSDNITAMSHSAALSEQGQKMRSLVGMPVLQVVQYVWRLWSSSVCTAEDLQPHFHGY